MDTEGSELFTVSITLRVRDQAAAIDLLADILRQIKSGAIKTEGFDLDCYASMEVQGDIAQWATPLPEVDGES